MTPVTVAFNISLDPETGEISLEQDRGDHAR